ncbi:eukaryotic rRNA processing [Coniophora puteana RWD-64-598 SS2]|uniref:Eukaryotic rRNA processing n=1 Tax=Coniophora puteana (strain RWD-64-598) TaxID=741705 RepID=R7SEP3_CONPW|nr:eukaryotic rRNA processing [Coniophora puteana RWD-64-598 SS2]EIW74651.1 eukaryotic rRNA processing [Coniophora puteana RWD-64-598 SS2]
MERIMELLGEEGLDDFDRAQLVGLAGDDDEEEDDGEEDEEEAGLGEEAISGESGSEEEEEDAEEGDEEEEEENDEDVVALDELEDAELDADAVPQQKVEIDDKIALERIRESIQLDPSLSWTETLVVSYPETIEVDVDDDLNRELAFYKQALHSANAARALAAKHSFPFTRPNDYFAEMVKSDAHMERIRQRLLDEGAGIKRSEEKRREREGKKFGKQVQQEKLKERQQSKKDMEDRLKNLKRKRKGALDNAEADADGFDVAVEDAIADRPSKQSRGRGGKKVSREGRDHKFGFGGNGRRSKQNTKASTDDFEGRRGGFKGGRGGRGGKSGGTKRPGKSKRVANRSKS